MFMCVRCTFRSSDVLVFVKNGFVVGARTLNVTAGHSNNTWYWRDPTIVSLPRLARGDTIDAVHLAKQHIRCALIWTSAGRQAGMGACEELE